MSRWFPYVLVLALMLSILSPRALAQEEDAQFKKIAQQIEQFRGLKFKSDVDRTFLTRKQFRKRLQKNAAEDSDNKEVERATRVLVAFGLAPEGVDLLERNRKYAGESVGGFYDLKTKKLYIIDTDRKLDPLSESIYSHELTHALQDQHFDLDTLRKKLKGGNDDKARALTSFIEGDATAVQTTYVQSVPGLAAKIRSQAGKRQPDPGVVKNTPRIIVESFRFPYSAGPVFAAALYRHGGFKALNAAYKDPPTSTEQIIHPEKYIKRDEPVDVKLPDLSATLGAGWKKLNENTFGEFEIVVLLMGEQASKEDFQAALADAAGWDGDRYALYASGDSETIIWQSVWDSPKEAQEFAVGLRAYDEGRFKSRYTERDGTLTLAAGGRVGLIRQKGTAVTYVLAPTIERGRRVLNPRAGTGREIPGKPPSTGGGAQGNGSRIRTTSTGGMFG